MRTDHAAPRVVDQAAEPERLGYLDDLKVALVIAIIAGHGVIGYATVGGGERSVPAYRVRAAQAVAPSEKLCSPIRLRSTPDP